MVLIKGYFFPLTLTQTLTTKITDEYIDIAQNTNNLDELKTFAIISNSGEQRLVVLDNKFQTIKDEIEVTNKTIGGIDIIDDNMFYNVGNQFYRYDLRTGIKTKEYKYDGSDQLINSFRYNDQYYAYDESTQNLINSDTEKIKIGNVTDMRISGDKLYVLDKNQIITVNLKTKKIEGKNNLGQEFSQLCILNNKLYLIDETGKIFYYLNKKNIPISLLDHEAEQMYQFNQKLYVKMKNTNEIKIYIEKK